MQISQIFIYLTSLLCVSNVLCSDNCTNLQVSISQKVENEGFHRDINWLIESLDLNDETWYESKCKVCLQLNVPPEMFINPDQISDLSRNGQIYAYIDGDVNIETPAHESTEHTVYIFLPNNNLEKVSVRLPVHLRYQRATIAGKFGKVSVPKPSLLVYCPKNDIQLCGTRLALNAPCDMTGNDKCSWQNVTYQALFDEVQLFVPIGDLDDYPVVSIITLLLGCAGSIYILSLLSTAPL